jgi:tetratricopeptide (TPR) repeat protein
MSRSSVLWAAQQLSLLTDRYATAQALADDLRRYLKNEPIRARRSSVVHRVRKLARRYPGVTVTAAAATLVGLLLGVVGLAVNNQMVREEKARTQNALNEAQQEKAIAQAVRDFLRLKLLAQADPRAQADALLRQGGTLSGPKPNPTIRGLLDRAAHELAPDRIEEQFPRQPLVQAEVLKTIGEAYDGIGDYDPAISHLKRAWDLQTQKLAADHPDILATMHGLARAYLGAGKPREAARLFEHVRDKRIETLGPAHADTLTCMNNLARCYYKLGQHEEVLRLRMDIVGRMNASLGSDHRATLDSMSNLANSYAANHRFADALQLHEETLALRRIKLGAKHADTLDSMNNLANCYGVLGHYGEALQRHEETLALRRETLGEDNPNTLQSMNNVAVACSALGQHARALKYHQEALFQRQARLNLNHPDTLYSMNAVAWVLATCPDHKLRDSKKALELAKQATDLAPQMGDYWNTLGAAYYREGDWKNAVGALTESMKLRGGGDGTDWFFLAMAHWQLGNKDQGRTWYDRAVQWMEEKKPQDEEQRQFRAEAAELLMIEK